MGDPVAAPPLAPLGRLARRAAGTLAALAGLYMLAGWVGSTIPRNPGWREPEAGITIIVESNGTHTGLVLPVTNAIKDWRATFPGIARARGGGATHIALGWGEREVFLDVPTWGDLTAATALRIGLVGGESVMRVGHYVHPAPGDQHRPLRLRPAEYRRLVAGIEAWLAPTDPAGERAVLHGSYGDDDYYEARGRYSLLRTSNNWTGDVLGDAGVRIGRWTPFAGGVMKWIELPPAD